MKPLKIIYYVFIACIAAIAFLLIVSVFPITGNYKIMTVLSGSMEPAIPKGGVVVVKPAADYKIGDVITFGETSRTKTPTTHRIFDVKVEGGEPLYITKGDANNAPDTRTIAKREIVGKVLFGVPYVGYAVATARKPYGFAALIIVPAAILIYDEGRKILKEVGKLKGRKKGEGQNGKPAVAEK